MNKLLAALGDDIRQTGDRKWMAKCPVHNDKDFAMSIKQRDDDSVIAHCFACHANGLALYRTLGLPLEELMGEREKSTDWVPSKIRENYELDKAVLLIAKHDEERGLRISWKDRQRISLATARIKGIEIKYPQLAQ